MACEPDPDFLVLVSSVVVEDGVDRDAGGYRARDAVEASRELLVAMPAGMLADDRAVEHGQGGKQRRRAVALGILRRPGCLRTAAHRLRSAPDV